jgi:hypothetical protein
VSFDQARGFELDTEPAAGGQDIDPVIDRRERRGRSVIMAGDSVSYDCWIRGICTEKKINKIYPKYL